MTKNKCFSWKLCLPSNIGLTGAALCVVTMLGSAPAFAQRPFTTGIRLADHTPPQVLNGTATFVGHYDPTQKLRLSFAIVPPHLQEEEQFLTELQTKGSPGFHQFLTPEEWNARFAPTPETEQAVVDWVTSHGFTVTNRFNHRLVVSVEAPVGVIEKALTSQSTAISFKTKPITRTTATRWCRRTLECPLPHRRPEQHPADAKSCQRPGPGPWPGLLGGSGPLKWCNLPSRRRPVQIAFTRACRQRDHQG
jgi:Pro-kumamolisin, activation domain